MSVDEATVRRIARLARIAVDEEDVPRLARELNTILGFVEQLQEVDVSDADPMTSVMPMHLRMRIDEISDGGYPDKVTDNAPQSDDHFFLVPKVVE